MGDIDAFVDGMTSAMVTRFTGDAKTDQTDLALLESFTLLDPNLREYNKGRVERYVQALCFRGFNFAKAQNSELTKSFSSWMDLATKADPMVNTNGKEIVQQLQDGLRTGGAEYAPMCRFGLDVLPVQLTFVICESGFSKYNSAHRSDRAELGDSSTEAYLLIGKSAAGLDNLDNGRFKHLHKTDCFERQADTTKMADKEKAARKVSRLQYQTSVNYQL